MTPDFSIIIPTCNHLPLARRAIGSVRCQQGVEVEVVVCDDSTDNGIEQYVQSLADSRIRYVHNRPALGAVSNWNAGLRQATGHYCIVLHHDEALTGQDYLARLWQTLRQTDAEVAVSEVRVIADGRRKRRWIPRGIKRWMLRHAETLFCLNAIGPCACVAFRRDRMQRFCEELHWLVDVEWYYRMLQTGRVAYCPTLVIESMHGHEGQISCTIDIMKAWRSDACIIRKEYRNKPLLWTMMTAGGWLMTAKRTGRKMLHLKTRQR